MTGWHIGGLVVPSSVECKISKDIQSRFPCQLVVIILRFYHLKLRVSPVPRTAMLHPQRITVGSSCLSICSRMLLDQLLSPPGCLWLISRFLVTNRTLASNDSSQDWQAYPGALFCFAPKSSLRRS